MSISRRKINTEKKSNKNFFLIFFIIFALILIYFKGNYDSFKEKSLILEDKEIIISKNDNFSNLAKKIPELENFYYKIYLKNNNPDFTLSEWKFLIKKWDNLKNIFKNLQKPIISTKNITILEWWNIFDIDKTLTEKWFISAWDFTNYATNKEKIIALKEFFPFLNENIISLEGYLYPDTYTIDSKNFKVNTFTIMLLEEFEKKVYEKYLKWKYDNKKINEILNLASIVEKEEWNEKNQAMVAGILKKRLNSDWQIWADATVCYPYNLPTSKCTQTFITNHIRDKNEYNTRTIKWLPKTPIANPSATTVDATINSQKSEYWYYLHNLRTWQIYYAKDDAEHKFNIKNYMNK